jgi:peptidyl-prolyl cis-trans isomerase A (cyclophilin A)
MRRRWWPALVVLCLASIGCSPSSETRTEKKVAPAAKSEKAPEVFRVDLDTSKGPVTIEVRRDWAPRGADHFYSLVKLGYYDGNRFFRVVRNFVVQFGISGDPAANRLWANANLLDDPVKQSNVKGTVAYAKEGPNSRSTQLFINLRDNSKTLDKTGFAPIGKVISGMDVVERFYNSYGDMAPRGQGPDPTKIETEGNEYLASRFPRLDYIQKAAIE